ncbi:RRXRR domain-containing protein [Acetobacterium sp.]|uniref:RRXRR domain-containing protein n=1 Tax=Acetobacterium sp. TaxID=1872094 RepID=UPI0027220F48|nr:RRXRR domain-containing protein [Acetobacterium sp.]MDO9492651.1 RRXRR domain-containing protein [Acetobacterium sp.]
MTDMIYILAPDGQPLMPTKRFKKIRQLLKDGKAWIVGYKPFTVQLLTEPTGRHTHRVIDGTDPGRTNIGACDILENGTVLYADVTITRNKDVPRNMKKRAAMRRASRRGERLARKRLARANQTTMKGGKVLRHLPGFGDGKTVPVKDIINTEARFSNRSRPEGWLSPTARHLVQTHLQGLKNRMKRLPITDAVVELNKFAFMAIDNPDIKRWQYQHGPLFGKGSVNEAVYEMQGGHCLFCRQPIAHYHHHDPQHRNGSDTLANKVGLCENHHTLVHNDQEWADKLDEKHTKLNKKYGALSVLNQAIPYILEGYVALLGEGHVFVTDGYTTHQMREAMALEKNHDQDAYVIACSILNSENEAFAVDTVESQEIRQFRRHDRAIIKSQNERTYKLDGVVVAKNRKKRMDQKDDSLQDWYLKTMRQWGRNEADTLRSRLKVEKSRRRYNNPDRVMPGAVFLYEKKRYVLQGQLTGGAYYRAVGQGNRNFPAKQCHIVAGNNGLVAI